MSVWTSFEILQSSSKVCQKSMSGSRTCPKLVHDGRNQGHPRQRRIGWDAGPGQALKQRHRRDLPLPGASVTHASSRTSVCYPVRRELERARTSASWLPGAGSQKGPILLLLVSLSSILILLSIFILILLVVLMNFWRRSGLDDAPAWRHRAEGPPYVKW